MNSRTSAQQYHLDLIDKMHAQELLIYDKQLAIYDKEVLIIREQLFWPMIQILAVCLAYAVGVLIQCVTNKEPVMTAFLSPVSATTSSPTTSVMRYTSTTF